MHRPWDELHHEALRNALAGSRVAVVGSGVSGMSAIHLLQNLHSKVFVSESSRDTNLIRVAKKCKFDYEIGIHSEKILDNDLIVLSPGVPTELPVLSRARTLQIPVWGELELGVRLLQSKKTVAVTGTNGKTTTVSLLYDIFKRSLKTLLAGNVGDPLCDYVFGADIYDVTVLEVSSYQCEGLVKFHPAVSVILNITPDHLARHGSQKDYAASKERLFINQTKDDFSILNWDDPWVREMEKRTSARVVWISKSQLEIGVFWDGSKNRITAKVNGKTIFFLPPKNLLGMHNIENCCAAVAVSLSLKVPPKQIEESLQSFKGVEHRLEKVTKICGVLYVNDSKATNVDSTLKALESFSQPLWIILGGEDKGASYLPIRKFIENPASSAKVKGVALIGEASTKIERELNGACELISCGTLKNAIKKLCGRARSGEIVLLAPACASFDQFKNFEDRGAQFKQLIHELKRCEKG